jgi:hypothetical protein
MRLPSILSAAMQAQINGFRVKLTQLTGLQVSDTVTDSIQRKIRSQTVLRVISATCH